MKKLRLALTFACLLQAFAVHAAEATVHVAKNFQGTWAAPDCGQYTEAVTLSGYFYLKATETDATFWPVYAVRKAEDYEALTIAGADHPIMRSEDSVLSIGDMEATTAGSWPDTWDALGMTGQSQYTGCHDMPTVVPLPLTHVMKHIDGVRDTCGADITPECRKLLFGTADANKNGRLSRAEFKKAGAMIATFAPLSNGGTVAVADLEAAYKSGIETGAGVAEDLLKTRDADGSGDLDKKEMEGFLQDLQAPALRAALLKIGKLLPAFTMAALDMPE